MGKWRLALVLGAGWLGALPAARAQLPAPGTPAPALQAPMTPPGTPASSPQPPPLPGPAGPGTMPPLTAPPIPPPGAAPSLPVTVCEPTPPENPFGTWAHGSAERERFYVNFEYLGWWVRKLDTPVLVTGGAFTDPVPAALGQPSTVPLVQGGDVDTHQFLNGGRLTLGYDLCGDESWTVLGSAFLLEQRSGHVGVGSTGAPGSGVIARPFFNANAGAPDADPIAVPGVMSGAINIDTPRFFYGGDVNLRGLYYSDYLTRVFFLAGVRYLSLDEGLNFTESLVDIPGLGTPGNSYGLSETFTTHNRFYGGQVGAAWESHFGPVFITVLGKLGVGPTFQTLATGAFTQINQGIGVSAAAFNHGLLVQPSNAGRFTHEQISVVPEFGFNLSIALSQNIRIGGGYNFIYWTQVARPDRAIDPTVNVQALQPFDQIGPARPAPLLQTSNFWAQGFTVSLEFCF